MVGGMSQKRTHHISCPFCGKEQNVELYDSILVDEEPELRAALLANRVNRVDCQGCGKSFRIDKPLVYQDRESRVLIQYDPLVGGRTLEEAEETFRAARAELEKLLPKDVEAPEMHLTVEWTELVERIFSEEEGLDARLLEHIKYMMFQQNPEKLPAERKGLLFDAQDSTEENLCFVVQDRRTKKLESMLHFARKDYEALVNVFDSGEQLALLHEQFPGPYINGRLKYLQDQMEESDGADNGVGPIGGEGEGHEHGHGDGCGCGCGEE